MSVIDLKGHKGTGMTLAMTFMLHEHVKKGGRVVTLPSFGLAGSSKLTPERPFFYGHETRE